MLTNFHYYNYYKPYIVKFSDKKDMYDQPITSKKYLIEKPDLRKYVFQTADNNEVFQYVQDFALSVNQLHIRVLEARKSIERLISKQFYDENREVEIVTKRVHTLLSQVEETIDFATEQDISDSMYRFGNELDIRKKQFTEITQGIFMNWIDEHEGKEFSYPSYNFLVDSEKDIEAYLGDVEDMINVFLDEPLTSHLLFKELDCFYNYTYDFKSTDAHVLLTYGCLFNLAI